MRKNFTLQQGSVVRTGGALAGILMMMMTQKENRGDLEEEASWAECLAGLIITINIEEGMEEVTGTGENHPMQDIEGMMQE